MAQSYLTKKTNELLGGDYFDTSTGKQIKPFTPPAINSEALTPQFEIPYNSPSPVPAPDVSKLEVPSLVATEPEGKATDFSKRLQDLNDSLVGKSTYRTEAENLAGIPQFQQRQSDLATQLKQLQNEALAIPQQLQQEATGRGITTGGLQPLQTARIRTNAIQALGISALLDATNGLIASAQTKVDRAVAAKYDPIQEEIDAATKNLNLIMNSPEYTLAEKNRAQAQLAIQEQKQEALKTQKDEEKRIYEVAIQAAENGADAVTLKNILASSSSAAALELAGGFLDSSESWSEPYRLGGDIVQKNLTTGQIRIAVNMPAGDGDGPGPGPNLSTNQINSILNSVGLPLTVSGSDGRITKSALNKVVSVNVPLEVAQAIWTSIVEDQKTLEQIRQELLDEFKDRNLAYGYLDRFMQALQGNYSDEIEP